MLSLGWNKFYINSTLLYEVSRFYLWGIVLTNRASFYLIHYIIYHWNKRMEDKYLLFKYNWFIMCDSIRCVGIIYLDVISFSLTC